MLVTAASAVTSDLDFLASGSFIGLGQGSLQVETLSPLVTPFGALFPTRGQIRVTRDQLEVTTLRKAIRCWWRPMPTATA